MNPLPIRVAVVDDHALFRESIARLLSHEPSIDIVGVCGALESARRLIDSVGFDVLLLDYDLGPDLGTDLIEYVKSVQPTAAVLMVSGGMSTAACRRVAQAGASGLVLKHSSPQQLLQVICYVAAGGAWWDESAQRGTPARTEGKPTFTERQHRILNCLLDGLTNKEMALKLDISEAAVKASLQEIFRKAGVRTRSQLVRIALELPHGSRPA